MGCSTGNQRIKDEPKRSISEVLPSMATASEDLKKHPTSKLSMNNLPETKISMNRLVGENKDAISKAYKIIERLGAGTFGKVYKVLHYPTGLHRAMKVVKRDSVNYQDDERSFLKEIELLAKLDHPNILKIFEYYIDDANYYVITELIMGGELYEQIVKLKNYSEKNAAIIMEQLLSAVCYLHSMNIVHRDLKPENIMLEMRTDEGKNQKNNQQSSSDIFIKLIDFGAANYLNKEGLNLKIGTPYYIAPEVLKKKYNNKCDIWSCGVIMYILLCAYPPFDGETDDEIIKSVEKGKFTFEGEEWDATSKEAKDIISKMLRYEPDKRISAADALKHNWFKNCLKSQEMDERLVKSLSANIQNIKKFNSRHKLQQACIAFLVHNMSSNELTKDLRAIFRKMDVTGDGRLTYDEIKEGYKKYFKGSNISEADFEELIKSLDGDNNEYIEYEEFLRATVNAELLMTEKNMEMAFAHFDKDGSGKLSPEEIKFVLGVNETDKNKEMEILKNIISEVDENGDGEVSFDEFKNLMKKFAK